MEVVGVIVHYIILATWTGLLIWGHVKSLQDRKEQEQKIKDLYEAISKYEDKAANMLDELDDRAHKSVDSHLRDADHLLYRIWSLESRLETSIEKSDRNFYEIKCWFDSKRK